MILVDIFCFYRGLYVRYELQGRSQIDNSVGYIHAGCIKKGNRILISSSTLNIWSTEIILSQSKRPMFHCHLWYIKFDKKLNKYEWNENCWNLLKCTPIWELQDLVHTEPDEFGTRRPFVQIRLAFTRDPRNRMNSSTANRTNSW